MPRPWPSALICLGRSEGLALSLAPSEKCVAIRVEGLSMGLTPEKQDHSSVMEPSLVRAMALLKGMAVLEVAAEKGVM